MTDRGADVHCPGCGAPAERGQLVCLECGARIALVYRRPPSWKVPAAITLLVALALGAGAALAVSALSDEADREVAAAPPRPQTTTTAAQKTGKDRSTRKAADTKEAGSGGAIVQKGALWAWPRSLEGFTVVINSTEDRASATKFARSAAKDKRAKLGVIRADDFDTLPKGFYVVFAGHYGSRAQADRATARLSRSYRGAFTQSVQR